MQAIQEIYPPPNLTPLPPPHNGQNCAMTRTVISLGVWHTCLVTGHVNAPIRCLVSSWEAARGSPGCCGKGDSKAIWEPLAAEFWQLHAFAGSIFPECKASLTQPPLSQNV